MALAVPATFLRAGKRKRKAARHRSTPNDVGGTVFAFGFFVRSGLSAANLIGD
jgi:hypothetical protein